MVDQRFGGQWTQEKLDILEKYLDAYTTALGRQNFSLMYIDGFAGTGSVRTAHDDIRDFLQGSTIRAAKIDRKPFDKLIFIENNPDKVEMLEILRSDYNNRNIIIERADANVYLRNFRENWEKWRGVLFLDPFATEVEWSTVETIAGLKALDMWILFPTHAVSRMLPRSRLPEDISQTWTKRLNRIYGNEDWKNLYEDASQRDLFAGVTQERDQGVEGLTSIYKQNLNSLFGERYLEKSRKLKNSQGSVLFELIFCVGHPNGTSVAKRIAGHILDYL